MVDQGSAAARTAATSAMEAVQSLGSARQRNRQWTLHAGCQGTGERHKGGSWQGCGSGGAQGSAAAGARALDAGHWSSEKMCMVWYENEQGPLFIKLLGS